MGCPRIQHVCVIPEKTVFLDNPLVAGPPEKFSSLFCTPQVHNKPGVSVRNTPVLFYGKEMSD
jgi:hypothetical protein